jgi:AraC-like DNA-binding protein
LIADPGAELTLSDWAGQVGASERTLTRLFERELGMSFGGWRQQVRLAHAAPLIARGVPLSQVSAQLGYASQSAFSAMFKKTFGCSPSMFFSQQQ